MDKTCGNCGKFALEPFKQRGGACMGSFDRDTCTYHSTSIHRDESNCPWCNGWIPKQEPIEQSYQQLTEVARKMFKHLCSVCDGGDVYNEDIADYRDGLKELGVEV